MRTLQSQEASATPRGTRFTRSALAAAAALALCGAPAQAAPGYLQNLLDQAAPGSWVKASTTPYSSAWATGPSGLPPQSFTNPATVVRAWSSVAWDSTRSNLLLWGGGHASYMGNEMYVWQGTDGSWTRGSLPSRIAQAPDAADARTFLVVDNAAPQSAHTYDNNLYLPVNDMFMTLGGAAYNTGSVFQVRDGSGNIVTAGPWMWDPRKADANKVGGTSGSGWDPAVAGGNMWDNRRDNLIGVTPGNFIQTASANRIEGGRDVVYHTVQENFGGYQTLVRYSAGDVRNGGSDTWERIGVSWYAPAGVHTATIDTVNNLYVHTSALNGFAVDLGVWDLSKSNPRNPSANRDIAIELVKEDGSAFVMNTSMALDFNQASGEYLMWDGKEGGTVWATRAEYKPDGSLDSSWLVRRLATPGAAPSGNFSNGVLGKWKYMPELGAFVALNEFSNATQDAEVWLYKPFAAAMPVPEPQTWALLLAGLLLVCWRGRAEAQRRAD